MSFGKIAIYTAVFGQYDPIKNQKRQNLPVDFVCFTDQEITHSDWKIITVPIQDQPRMQAKYYKLVPHQVPELHGYDHVIWVDGSFVINNPDFAEWAISNIKNAGWAMYAHNKMDCAYDEAGEMALVKKYQDMPITEQAAHYKSQRYPAKNGLYFGGLIVRDMRNTQWHTACDAWWQENNDWTLRDQISLPYVLWQHKTQLDTINGDIYDNPYFNVQNAYRNHEYDRYEAIP